MEEKKLKSIWELWYCNNIERSYRLNITGKTEKTSTYNKIVDVTQREIVAILTLIKVESTFLANAYSNFVATAVPSSETKFFLVLPVRIKMMKLSIFRLKLIFSGLTSVYTQTQVL
jgi:hypothetical protein